VGEEGTGLAQKRLLQAIEGSRDPETKVRSPLKNEAYCVDSDERSGTDLSLLLGGAG
jgi:hypothetical protein